MNVSVVVTISTELQHLRPHKFASRSMSYVTFCNVLPFCLCTNKIKLYCLSLPDSSHASRVYGFMFWTRQIWAGDEYVWRRPGRGAHGWGEGDHQRRAGSCCHDGGRREGEDWVSDLFSVLQPLRLASVHGVQSMWRVFLLPVPSDASPVVWMASGRLRVAMDSHNVCCVGSVLDLRGSQLSSVCSATK